MSTPPSSSTLTFAPVASVMPLMLAPRGPISAPTASGMIEMWNACGTWRDGSPGSAIVFCISARMCRRPSRA